MGTVLFPRVEGLGREAPPLPPPLTPPHPSSFFLFRTEQPNSAYLPGSDVLSQLYSFAQPEFFSPSPLSGSTIFLGISAFQLLLLFSDVCIDLSVFLFLIFWFCFFHSDLSFIPLSDPLFCLLSLFICFSLCFCPIDYCSVSFCLSLRSFFFCLLPSLPISLSFFDFLFLLATCLS